MSTLVEALSVVIPRHVLDAGYPGGTEGYLDTARRARGARYAICDERLACVSFASPTDADSFTAPLSALGLGGEDGTPPPVACLDEDFGPTAACPWLRWRRHDDGFTSCWLEWTEPGELATPTGWLPPRQRAAANRAANSRPAVQSMVAPASVGADELGKVLPQRVIPTAIGPLTPISSPAVLAAMAGGGAANGHVPHDDDDMSELDRLVALAECPAFDANDDMASLADASATDEMEAEETVDSWALPEFESTASPTSIGGDADADCDADAQSDADFMAVDDTADHALNDVAIGVAATHDAIGDDEIGIDASDVGAMDIDVVRHSDEDADNGADNGAFRYDAIGPDTAGSHAVDDSVPEYDDLDMLREPRVWTDGAAGADEACGDVTNTTDAVHAASVAGHAALPEPADDATLAVSDVIYEPPGMDSLVAVAQSTVQDRPCVDGANRAEPEIASAPTADFLADERVDHRDKAGDDPSDDFANAFVNASAGDADDGVADDMASDIANDVANDVASVMANDRPDDSRRCVQNAYDEAQPEGAGLETILAGDVRDEPDADTSTDGDFGWPQASVDATPAVHDVLAEDTLDDEATAVASAGWSDIFDSAHAALSTIGDTAPQGPIGIADDVEALFQHGDSHGPLTTDTDQQPVATDLLDTAITPASATLTPAAMTAVAIAAPRSAAADGAPALDAVREHLADIGWRYSQDSDQGALFYQTAGGRASYPGFAAADHSARLVWLYTQIPVRVPEHRRADAVELLTRANHGLAVGNFEFDYADGEVRFKAVADTGDGCFSAATAGRLLRHSLEACDRYHDALMQVIYGGLSPADAVR